MDGVGNVCPQPNGSYEVFSPDGRTSLGFIRHVDPVPTEADPVFPASGNQVECVDGASGTYYIHVVYARAYNDADGYNTWAPTIRTMIGNANQLVDDATVATGGTGAGLKVLCSGGTIVVENEVLDTSAGSASFSTIVNDLRFDKGYNDPKTKVWVFYDDTGACGCGGTGHWYDDDSDSVNNVNNGNYASQPFFAVNFGYNSVRIMLHELGHNIGAVQDSAPRSTLAGHCYDGRDTMCYNDGGPNGNLYSTGYCGTEIWDCGRNDYFHASPASGSYLDTHWNIGDSYNRYIRFGEVNAAPTMTALSCSPTNALIGDTITCSFTATDSRDQLAYNLAWGDGTTQRVPSSGFVASGTSLSSTHAYGTDAIYTMSVTATDNNATGAKTSAALTRSIAIQAAPTMNFLSCSPNPAEVARSTTCTFRAADNSTGVYYNVSWGDGSPIQRVPATGYVAPGTARTASHTFGATGSYTVAVDATDNGAPPLASNTMTTSVAVDPNVAPSMTDLSCSPNPVQEDFATTCSFRASDSYSVLYYTLDWGDGSPTQRVPASGTVSPGVMQSATKTLGTPGTYTVSVTATDEGSPVLTSSSRTTSLVINANAAPTMTELSCTPNPVQAQNPTTCTFRGTDTIGSIYYTVDWGDGSATQRVPSSGYLAPGTSQSASKTYGAQGDFTVSVTATDNGSPALTSPAQTTIVQATFANIAPVMQSASCNPSTAYQQASCSVRATDTDSGGVKYTIQWGDGTTSVVPATGYTAANSSYATGHVYTAPGTYTMNVTATDNGSPARTSQTLSTTVTIGPDVTPPTLTVQEPRGGRLYQGCGLVTFIAASMDATFAGRGCAKATATDPSGIANVTVKINGVTIAVDSSAPYEFDFPVGVGLDAELEILAYDARGNVRSSTIRVDMV